MRLLLTIAAALLAVIASAQQDFEFWPNADYDPSIPTIESVLGHAPGEPGGFHRETSGTDTQAQSQPDPIPWRVCAEQ